MCNKEEKECVNDLQDNTCKCENCKHHAEHKGTETLPNGEKVARFSEAPTIVDIAKMLESDEGFKKAVEGAVVVATRILKHTNGQDVVLQVFYRKEKPTPTIQVVHNLPMA